MRKKKKSYPLVWLLFEIVLFVDYLYLKKLKKGLFFFFDVFLLPDHISKLNLALAGAESKISKQSFSRLILYHDLFVNQYKDSLFILICLTILPPMWFFKFFVKCFDYIKNLPKKTKCHELQIHNNYLAAYLISKKRKTFI